jgi:3'(2'), 5'-bisphosphate nucleotidase
MNFSAELSAAIVAAREAGAAIRREYETFVPIPDAPVTISTHVDRLAQDLILDSLAAAFPDDGFVAEEATASYDRLTKSGSRMWVVDPIDGTRGFAKKNGQFSVMVGLTIDGRPVVGAVYEPIPDILTYAAIDGGCFVQRGDAGPVKCRVRECAALADSIVVKSHTKPGMSAPEVAVLAPAGTIVTYSAGIKLALVARGEADIYPNDYSRFSDWDICAGHILVTEAGGTVTQLRGKPITYHRDGGKQAGGLLATNGRLHEAAVERLRTLPTA